MAYLQRLCRGHQMIENVLYWHIADVPLALTNVFLSNIALNPRGRRLVIPNATPPSIAHLRTARRACRQAQTQTFSVNIPRRQTASLTLLQLRRQPRALF